MRNNTFTCTLIVKDVLKKMHLQLKALVTKLHFYIWRLQVRIRTRRLATDIDIHQLHWIDPRHIQYGFIKENRQGWAKYRDKGKVIGGNWDQKRVRFEDCQFRILPWIEEVLIHGTPWQETRTYKYMLKEISGGWYLWGCKNKADLDKRCMYLESIFYSIKENGYKSQGELAGDKRGGFKNEDEISVRIGRSGNLLFEDGQHRLAIAKLLKLEKVPIKITVRHAEWYRFQKEVIDYAKSHGGLLYQPVTHPDLCHIPSLHGDEEFEIIKANLPVQGGDLLDIGAHWGYFCHRFEELGFNCYAVETTSSNLYFLDKLRIAENRKFNIISGSIFEYHDKNNFDVVLALNVFHNFIKTGNTYYMLIDMLRRLDMKVMFFQAEPTDSPQMKSTYRNFNSEEFIDFILKNSKLNEFICIGETKQGGLIYRLQSI